MRLILVAPPPGQDLTAGTKLPDGNDFGAGDLKAIDVKLSGEDMKALDEVSKLSTEYPAWMDNLGTDRRPGERRY